MPRLCMERSVPGCFGLSEFENYVAQIAMTHPGESKIVAVKVTNAEQIGDIIIGRMTTGGPLEDIRDDVVDALSALRRLGLIQFD